MFGRKKPVCETCGIPAHDVLAIDKNSPLLCRDHLLERFEAVFLAFEHPFVVCEPHFAKHSDSMYPYYPLARLVKEYSFTRDDEADVGGWLASIAGSCRECEEPARTLYVPHSATAYDSKGPVFASFHVSDAVLYCRQHSFRALRPLLGNHPKSFDDGLVPPHEGPGIFVSTFL